MKYLLVCALAVAVASAAPRDKRFTGLSIATSGFGGATGCVVTGNTLYANGLEVRQLTPTEMNELGSYQTKLDEYKKQLKENLEARRQSLKNRMQGKESTTDKEVTTLTEPPKPSFCTDSLTTQYIFDGCMVQDNKVYVGRQYARDLSTTEQQELKDYDNKMSVYQKFAQAQMQKQMKSIFGGSDFFSALFSDQIEATAAPAPTEPSTDVAPEVPKAPNFCTVIY